MTHCERCGHPLSSHDAEGRCSHAVNFGDHGICTCGTFDAGYLRAVVSLPEMLAAALHAGPGRDKQGAFYSTQQARLVARYAEALLDTIQPIASINAVELCEAWRDAANANEQRDWSLKSGGRNGYLCTLTVHDIKTFARSAPTARDAAAKCIMLAGQEGFES